MFKKILQEMLNVITSLGVSTFLFGAIESKTRIFASTPRHESVVLSSTGNIHDWWIISAHCLLQIVDERMKKAIAWVVCSYSEENWTAQTLKWRTPLKLWLGSLTKTSTAARFAVTEKKKAVANEFWMRVEQA